MAQMIVLDAAKLTHEDALTKKLIVEFGEDGKIWLSVPGVSDIILTLPELEMVIGYAQIVLREEARGQ